MKQVKLSALGDTAIFQFNKRTGVIWEIQTPGNKKVIATATKSRITRTFPGSKLVWCKDE